MAVTNTKTTLASRLKEQYNSGISQLVPVVNFLRRSIEFKSILSPGELARFDVQMALENGFSVGAAGSDFSLNPSIAQESVKAEVDGCGILLRSRVAYGLITAAQSKKQAFATFNDKKFIPMVESFSRREELLTLVGRQGLGVVDSNTSGVLKITEKSWNPTRWIGLKGAVLEAFTAISGGSQHNTDLVITNIDIAAREITVSGTSAAVVQNDILFFKGHRGVEPIGLMHIARNTGTLYGINAANYELWKASKYDVGTSGLTLGKILEAAANAGDKGCAEKLVCLVPLKAFQGLVSDEAALVRHDAQKRKAENGFEYLSFYGATGEIEIVPYHNMEDGSFLMYPPRWVSYIGSTEVVPQVGTSGDIYFDVSDSAAKEMRLFAEWTVFCERPGYIVWGERSDGKALHADAS